MKPNETGSQPDTQGMDRREFLRLSGTLAAAGALASAGCQVPQEATIPFHDMPENLVDGIGRARFFHTVHRRFARRSSRRGRGVRSSSRRARTTRAAAA